MTLSPRPRPFRVLALSLVAFALFSAPRVIGAQTPEQVFNKEADALVGRIKASPLTAEMKDGLLAEVAKARAANVDVTNKTQMVDRQSSILENGVNAFRSLEGLVKEINGTPDTPDGLKTFYVDLVNANLKHLPANWSSVNSQLNKLKSQFTNFGAFIAEARAFNKTVAAGVAPAPLKKEISTVIEETIAKLGPTDINGVWKNFRDLQTRYNNSMLLVGRLDSIKTVVATEAPAVYPEFKTNTVKEANTFRDGVGTAQGGIGYANVEAFRKTYQQRLLWVKKAADILARTAGGNIVTAAQNGAFRARLALIVPGIVDYHSPIGVDPNGLDDLRMELDRRDAKKP